MSKPKDLIKKADAIREAKKRLPFRHARETEEILDMAGTSLTEAYRLGAEEAQAEIVARLAALPRQGAG